MNTLNPNPVNNPVALVTGAGPGLGGALAVGLAQAGARLVICDIDPDRLQLTEQRLLTMGAEVLARVCDVSDSAAVDALVAEAARHFGTVHVLVNNAALVPARPAATPDTHSPPRPVPGCGARRPRAGNVPPARTRRGRRRFG